MIDNNRYLLTKEEIEYIKKLKESNSTPNIISKSHQDIIASGNINLLTNFNDWSPKSNLGFSEWKNSNLISKDTNTQTGTQSLKMQIPSEVECGINIDCTRENIGDSKYVYIECTFMLDSTYSNISGAGIVFEWGYSTGYSRTVIDFSLEKLTIDKWYTVKKVIKRSSDICGLFREYRCLLAGSSKIVSSNCSQKTIHFNKIAIRQASEEEAIIYDTFIERNGVIDNGNILKNVSQDKFTSGLNSNKIYTSINDGNKNVGSKYYEFGVGYSNNNAPEEEFIQVDLGQKYSINNSALYFYSGDDRYYYYKIKYSTDGISWKYAVGSSDNDGWVTSPKCTSDCNPTIDTFRFNLNARYLRLYCNGNTVNRSNHIYEWELYSRVQNFTSKSNTPEGPISGSQIIPGTVTGTEIKEGSIGSLHIIDASIDSAKIKEASILTAHIGEAQITSAHIGEAQILSAHIGEAEISSAHIGTAQIQSVHIGKAQIISAHIKDAEITSAKIGDAQITTAKIGVAQIMSAHIGEAQIETAHIGEAVIVSAHIGEAQILNAHIKNGEIDNAKIKNASIDNAKIKDASIDSAKIKEASIETAHIKDAQITSAKIETAFITELTANYGYIIKLKSDYAEITEVVSKMVTTDELEAVNAHIKNLWSDKASITELESVSIKVGKIEGTTANFVGIFADVIDTGHINAGSALIAEGAIGNAHISKLSADKVDFGTLNTTKVTIQGANGRMKLSGDRIQFFQADKTGLNLFERISIGDVNNDGTAVGFRVRGKDGKTILYDENGVREEGITDGAITNEKISGNTKIDGKKIDIATMVTEINNGTETISGAIVELDNKTLNVAISEINTTQKNNTEVIANHTSSIKEMKDKISLTVSSTTFEETIKGIDITIKEVSKNVNYDVEIFSTNGGVFKNGNISTTLIARVYHGATDITDTIDSSRFRWTRISSNTLGDKAWNTSHFGGTKQINVNQNDVFMRATFNCEILESI